MASPHVAGAWAILKQAEPTATVDEVLQAFTEHRRHDHRHAAPAASPPGRASRSISRCWRSSIPGCRSSGSVIADRGTVGTSLQRDDHRHQLRVRDDRLLRRRRHRDVDDARVRSRAHRRRSRSRSRRRSARATSDADENPAARPIRARAASRSCRRRRRWAWRSSASSRRQGRPGPHRPRSRHGALDGTFKVIVQGGIWPRTVTRLELRRAGGDHGTPIRRRAYWVLRGHRRSRRRAAERRRRDGELPVADGGAFFMFASDLTPTLFTCRIDASR